MSGASAGQKNRIRICETKRGGGCNLISAWASDIDGSLRVGLSWGEGAKSFDHVVTTTRLINEFGIAFLRDSRPKVMLRLMVESN